MKKLFCLSTLFFCTNSNCNLPLQYLLTDAIICHGGSSELVRMFNSESGDDSEDMTLTIFWKKFWESHCSHDILLHKPELAHRHYTITVLMVGHSIFTVMPLTIVGLFHA